MSVNYEKRGRVDYIDSHVGNKVRSRRLLLGLSQEVIGDALRMSIQQVQKYEQGINRISSGNLYRIGQALNVPINYFFEEVEFIDSINSSLLINSNEKEAFTLMKAYNRITCPKAKRKIVELVVILSGDGIKDAYS